MNKKLIFPGIVVFGVAALLLFLITHRHPTDDESVPSLSQATSTKNSATPTAGSAVNTQTQKYGYVDEVMSFSTSQNLHASLKETRRLILSLRSAAGKDSFLDVYSESTPICYQKYCTRPTLSTQTINGVTWDYLGSPEYCDSKNTCNHPTALYKTKKGVTTTYLAFFNYADPIDESEVRAHFVLK